jgi:alpha-D-ribose 1-methylphosphonate 5-triphosphate synthase subunit PhnL
VRTIPLLIAQNISKTFTLHVQGGSRLPVLDGVSLTVRAGEAVVLTGVSGSGKSTFLRCLYGNYRVDEGTIRVRDGDGFAELTALEPHALAALRTRAIGYVSQFLRAIPRVPAIDVAAEPLLAMGFDAAAARERIAELFERLHLPERLWQLSPTTFSGGERQRVNVARALAPQQPILLVDEPTSALDQASRERVLALLAERREAGTAVIGIFHDEEARTRLGASTVLHFGERVNPS